MKIKVTSILVFTLFAAIARSQGNNLPEKQSDLTRYALISLNIAEQKMPLKKQHLASGYSFAAL